MLRKVVIPVVAALVALGAAPVEAQTARPAVSLDVKGLFGDELLLPNAYGTLIVTARNNRQRAMRGTLAATVRRWGSPPIRHETRLDLPAGARRQSQLTMFFDESSTVEVTYEVDGATLGRGSVSLSYSPSSTGIVVMNDPPRLRGALLDLNVDQSPDPYSGEVRAIQLPVGVVSFDAATRDPMLPLESVGWATVELLITSSALMGRAGGTEQGAMADWIRSGGSVLVFLRSEGDLREPFLRSLIGDVTRIAGVSPEEQARLVPEGARGAILQGGPGFRSEAFGGSRAVGFGRVYLAVYDGTAPPMSESPETRDLVLAILQDASGGRASVRPLLAMGRGKDDLSAEWWGGGPAFGTLRAALDPNEGYRPALGLVAVVLLLYVLIVGPVNFTFVGRRNRPTLALVTTPVAAIACLTVMLGVGYLGKGARMRYRAVEVIEAVEGNTDGPARRYSGLFLTRPWSFDIEPPERGVAMVIQPASADAAPTVDHASGRPVLRNVRGRLWETVFMREDRVVELGGSVTFERDGRRLTAVHNGTRHAIRGAMVVDGVGSVFRVGDIPPGQSRPIAQAAGLTVSASGAMFYGPDDANLGTLTTMLGLADDDRPIVDGAIKALGGSIVTPAMPTLFGRMDAESRGSIAEVFAPEIDLVFVRIVPDAGDRGIEIDTEASHMTDAAAGGEAAEVP